MKPKHSELMMNNEIAMSKRVSLFYYTSNPITKKI